MIVVVQRAATGQGWSKRIYRGGTGPLVVMIVPMSCLVRVIGKVAFGATEFRCSVVLSGYLGLRGRSVVRVRQFYLTHTRMEVSFLTGVVVHADVAF